MPIISCGPSSNLDRISVWRCECGQCALELTDESEEIRLVQLNHHPITTQQKLTSYHLSLTLPHSFNWIGRKKPENFSECIIFVVQAWECTVHPLAQRKQALSSFLFCRVSFLLSCIMSPFFLFASHLWTRCVFPVSYAVSSIQNVCSLSPSTSMPIYSNWVRF